MTRHEQRYKAMTILYQAFLYDNNNINYDIKDIINEQLPENNKVLLIKQSFELEYMKFLIRTLRILHVLTKR